MEERGKGDVLTEYRVQVISKDDSCRRELLYRQQWKVKDYIILLQNGTVIDGTTSRSTIAVFVNHSCAPNCEYLEYDDPDTGETYVFLHAFAILYKGEYLTVDYQIKTNDEDGGKIKCLCQAPPEVCLGYLGWDNKRKSDSLKLGEDHRQVCPKMLVSVDNSK